MGAANAGWVFADAWVFAAIATNGRRCSLADLVGAADMINHAILLDTEVEAALGKLTGAGLVRVFDDWTFEVTDDGAGLWPGLRDVRTQIDSMTVQLAVVEPGRATVKLPAGTMDGAVKEYLQGAHPDPGAPG